MKTLKRNIGKVRHKVNFFPIFFSFTPFFIRPFQFQEGVNQFNKLFLHFVIHTIMQSKRKIHAKKITDYIIIYKNYWCAFSIICHNFSIFTSRTNKRLNKPMFTLFFFFYGRVPLQPVTLETKRGLNILWCRSILYTAKQLNSGYSFYDHSARVLFCCFLNISNLAIN